MRVVVDTNVFVSGVFFGGVPGRVLELWEGGELEFLMKEEIFAEYVDVLRRLAARYPGVDPEPIVGLVTKRGFFVQPAPLRESVCVDQDDDKFVAAAIGGQGRVISQWGQAPTRYLRAPGRARIEARRFRR